MVPINVCITMFILGGNLSRQYYQKKEYNNQNQAECTVSKCNCDVCFFFQNMDKWAPENCDQDTIRQIAITHKNESRVSADLCLVLYRSQNVLCRSKCFEPAQKFDFIQCLFKTFCAGTKNNFTECKSSFCLAQNVCDCHNILKKNGLAQKIWTSTKHFGTCKRTRHQYYCKPKIKPLNIVPSFKMLDVNK